MTSRDEVVELRKAGLTYDEIGRRFGMSRESAREIATDKPPPPKPAKPMLTSGGVAQLLGVRPNTVRHWSDKGILKAYRIGPRSDRRFRREDVDALLKESLLKGRELSHVGQPAGNGTWCFAVFNQ